MREASFSGAAAFSALPEGRYRIGVVYGDTTPEEVQSPATIIDVSEPETVVYVPVDVQRPIAISQMP
jgi:hypothetical protein